MQVVTGLDGKEGGIVALQSSTELKSAAHSSREALAATITGNLLISMAVEVSSADCGRALGCNCLHK